MKNPCTSTSRLQRTCASKAYIYITINTCRRRIHIRNEVLFYHLLSHVDKPLYQHVSICDEIETHHTYIIIIYSSYCKELLLELLAIPLLHGLQCTIPVTSHFSISRLLCCCFFFFL